MRCTQPTLNHISLCFMAFENVMLCVCAQYNQSYWEAHSTTQWREMFNTFEYIMRHSILWMYNVLCVKTGYWKFPAVLWRYRLWCTNQEVLENLQKIAHLELVHSILWMYNVLCVKSQDWSLKNSSCTMKVRTSMHQPRCVGESAK